MGDFDLSDALDSPPALRRDSGFEARLFDSTGVQDEIISLDVGLDLVVSRNPVTMQGVATLMLAVSRMKKTLKRNVHELCGPELCSIIMDSLVDEKVLQTIQNNSTGERRLTFQRVNSGMECTLCDTSKKDVVLATGDLKLQAITLKGGYGSRKVSFKLARYAPAVCAPSGDSQTVVLSITNQNLHISCIMKDDNAELQLETCSEDDLRDISNDGNMDRFLFFRRTTGRTLTSFESVKCRGWFISTSYEKENEPVEMCKEDTAHRLTYFNVN